MRKLLAVLGFAILSNASASLFKREFANKIAVPYSGAIDKFSSLLLVVENEVGGQETSQSCLIPTPVSAQLRNKTKSLHNHMKLCANNANNLVLRLDKETENLSKRVNKLKREISENGDQLKKVSASLPEINKQIALELQAVEEAKLNLKTHQEALDLAKYRYHQAKSNCFGRRRRKRNIFKDALKEIKKAAITVGNFGEKVGKGAFKIGKKAVMEVYKGICKVVNLITKQIQKEEKSIENARRILQTAESSLKRKQAEFHRAKTTLDALHAKKLQLMRRNERFSSEKIRAKTRREIVLNLNAEAKKATLFLTSLLSRANVFKFRIDLGYILDPENLIHPLESIYLLITKSGKNRRLILPALPEEKIAQIQARIQNLKSWNQDHGCGRKINISIP